MMLDDIDDVVDVVDIVDVVDGGGIFDDSLLITLILLKKIIFAKF
jgi:hypothetical protein